MRIKSLLISAVLLASALTASAQQYDYTTVKGDPMQTRIYTLPNGLKVYMSINREQPRLQANIAVRTGSRNDPAETTGLAHYLEHLMFKGTQQFGTTDYQKEKPYLDEITRRYEAYRKLTDPKARKEAYHEIDSVSQLAAKYNIPNEYDKLMASLGSDGSNAYTSNDITCYVENIPNNEIENWARVQGDRFQNMVIRGFHTELEAVYEEKNITMGSDGDKMWAAMGKLLYPTHPYGTQTTIGEQEHLKNPSIVNIMNYYHRYYVPNNVAIVLAGDFDPDKTIRIIDKYFGGWKPNPTLSRPEFAPQPNLTAERDTTVLGQDAANVVLGWKFEGASSLQRDTLSLVSDILSNGRAGLFDVDINDPMKAQGVMAGLEDMHDYTTFIVMGSPKEGQSLREVRQLVLDELAKLRRGDFDESLLKAIAANNKLSFYRSLDKNDRRAQMMGDAFVTDTPWETVVGRLDREAKITKDAVVAFANKYLRDDNFACVYKEVGEDTTIKKIEKPQITPIPANREYQSQFVKEIVNSHVDPIQPKFVDFKKDLTVGTTKAGLPLLYKQNTQDGLFNLVFRYKLGDQDDVHYSYAANYLDYIGTQKKSVSQIKKDFYDIACNYGISQNERSLQISLSGLNENLPQALALLNDYLQNAKADPESWQSFVALVRKTRADNKTNQKACFQALFDYGVYGSYNPTRKLMSDDELQKQDPQQLIDLLKGLQGMKHEVLYYGPSTEADLNKLLKKEHKTPKRLADCPQGKEYMEQQTPQNEIILAPYEAKNIYMRMIHNEGRAFNVSELGKEELFNEYFGGGMNTIVFQELRETRGLAYNAWATYRTLPYRGHNEWFMTHIISQNDKMMDCIRTFHDILDNMPQNDKAFDLAKQSLMKNYQAQRVTKFNVLNQYIVARERGLDKSASEIIYNQLPGLTLQDIVNFQKQNIAKKAYRYIILGDEKELDMKSLEQIAPVRRVSLKDIFGY